MSKNKVFKKRKIYIIQYTVISLILFLFSYFFFLINFFLSFFQIYLHSFKAHTHMHTDRHSHLFKNRIRKNALLLVNY